MHVRGIGVDAVQIARFRKLSVKVKDRFMANTFSPKERAYCLSYKDSAPHFAGTFAAKEAVQKAANLVSMAPTAIEILRTKAGKPEVWLEGKRSKSILISITHEKTLACAVALYCL